MMTHTITVTRPDLGPDERYSRAELPRLARASDDSIPEADCERAAATWMALVEASSRGPIMLAEILRILARPASTRTYVSTADAFGDDPSSIPRRLR